MLDPPGGKGLLRSPGINKGRLVNCKSVECQTENEQQSGGGRERDPGLGNVEGWRVRLVGALGTGF